MGLDKVVVSGVSGSRALKSRCPEVERLLVNNGPKEKPKDTKVGTESLSLSFSPEFVMSVLVVSF